MIIEDPKVELSKEKLKELCDLLVEAVAWNATPKGIDAQEDRGYSATAVVSGMIGDIINIGARQGVDVVDAIFSAMAMHDSYGRFQSAEVRAAAGQLEPVLKNPFNKDYARMLQRPVR